MLKLFIPLVCVVMAVSANTENTGTYIITLPNKLQPGTDYNIKVDILTAENVTVEATLEELVYHDYNYYQNKDQEVKKLQTVSGVFSKGKSSLLTLTTEVSFTCSRCQIRLRGTDGLRFEQVAYITISSPVAVIMVQTDKPIYKPGQAVHFRTFAVFSDLKFYLGKFTTEIKDPDNNVIKIYTNVSSPTGVVESTFQLGDQTNYGTWTIRVSTVDLRDTFYSQTFEVSQYSLPRFEVTIQHDPYALTEKELLVGTVKARYTFGKPVKGQVELYFGPNQGNDYCGKAPKTVQIGFAIDGEASFTIPKADINRVVSIGNLAQVKMTAIVTEDSTGVRLNGSSVITWYSNKYQIKFADNTPSVFKAGLPYTAYFKVTTPDNKPPTAKDIVLSVYTSVNYQLVVEDQAFYDVPQFTGTYPLVGKNVTVPANGLVAVDIDIPKNATSITIRASIKEVYATKTISKMISKSNNFVQLTLLDSNIKSGSKMNFKVQATEPLHELVYEIMARNEMIETDSVNGNGEKSFNLEFLVLPEYAPTAHLIVYYKRPANDEIVADSVAFNVEGAFHYNLSIAFKKNESEPNKNTTLEVISEPNAEVYIAAVDQSILLLKSGNDITSEKVCNSLNKFDNTEKPSGSELALSSSAESSEQVFDKSGLRLITDIPPTPVPVVYSYTKAKIIMTINGFNEVHDSKLSLRSEGTIRKEDLQVGRIRNIFPEAWLVTKVHVSENGVASFSALVPDTITSWIASAFAAHPSHGLSVAPTTASLKVFRSFFLSLNYVQTIVRGELSVIEAVVYNYLSEALTVTVTLKGSDKFQSVIPGTSLEVHKPGDHVQDIKVESQKQGVVYFSIIANKIGVVDIEVTAVSPLGRDGVSQKIIVKAEGAPVSFNYPVFVNLDKEGTVKQLVNFSLPLGFINGSDTARIKVSGDLIGASLGNINSLLAIPSACGEQSLVKFAVSLYIAQYLQSSGQLTDALKSQVIEQLELGYQRQLTFKRFDNAFSAFGNRDDTGNTWLTAFVSRVLFEAKSYTYIQDNVVYGAIDWLVQRQNKDGSFSPIGNVLDSTTQGTESGPALTAYVLLSLTTARSLATLYCNNNPNEPCLKEYEWGNATVDATKYLEKLVDADSIKDQFPLALVSYVLTKVKSDKGVTALKKLETFAPRQGGLLFWTDNSTVSNQAPSTPLWRPPHVNARPIDILITSYAILTYVAQEKLQEAFPAVQWLSKERNPFGGFASSQDTAVGLQALAAFATAHKKANLNLNVKISSDVSLAEFQVNKENALNLQIKELKNVPTKLQVEVTGTGLALVEIVYNVHVSKELTSSSFDVNTVILEDGLDFINLMICTKWNGKSKTGMVVQEISTLSGFTPDLDSLSSVAGIKRAERKGDNVNIYFDEIGKTSTCYNIRMSRTGKVARTQENYVRTWMYYDPKNQGTVFYQAKRAGGSNIIDVCNKCSVNPSHISLQ